MLFSRDVSIDIFKDPYTIDSAVSAINAASSDTLNANSISRISSTLSSSIFKETNASSSKGRANAVDSIIPLSECNQAISDKAHFIVSGLMENISQLLEIPSNTLLAIADEISQTDIPYKAVHDEYQSGGWHTAVLYTPGKENSDAAIHGDIAKPTALAESMPLTKKFLRDLKLDYFTVHIARNDPDSWLWEHRDCVELDEERKRVRLHVPLIANPKAIVQFSQCAVFMAPGWIWKFNPTINHSISNTSLASRTHLILDCYKTRDLLKLLGNEILEAEHVRPLPQLDFEKRSHLLAKASNIFRQEGSEKAEQHLLKSFHEFDLGQETSYDLLIDFYCNMDFGSRENYWIAEKITRIYHTDKIDPEAAVRNMRGTLFSNPHSLSSNLPQFRVFQDVLKTCRQYPGLEKAYVLGSLARGNVDQHSNIDLLCVVAPQEFASFVERVDAGIKKYHDPLTDAWVDTIVKDFGGVGFVYLLNTEEGLYQLDLYIACQGHPSLENMTRLPHKKEMFRRIHREDENKPSDFLNYRLHSKQVEQQIQTMDNIKPSVAQTLTELSVRGFMIKKFLDRGDEFLGGNEFNMWKRCFIKLVRHRFDWQNRDSGFHHIHRLISKASDNGSLYEDLRAINNHPLTLENFINAHHYAMEFVQTHFPADYIQQQGMILAVSQHIEDHRLGQLEHKLSSWGNIPLAPAHSSGTERVTKYCE
jgi:predicted nucleotidyltransferase